jgi:NAD(P)-dependent dehydrogenase (short-subunit alcohol dehydrogenase family)
MDLEVFQRVVTVNLFGYVNVCKHTLPHLKKTKGLIVGISSLSGILGLVDRTAYCASKHAVEGFFNSLRLEIKEYEVDITVPAPSTIRGTNFRKNSLAPPEVLQGEEGSSTVVELKDITD